jgi:hypothetical protein
VAIGVVHNYILSLRYGFSAFSQFGKNAKFQVLLFNIEERDILIENISAVIESWTPFSRLLFRKISLN